MLVGGGSIYVMYDSGIMRILSIILRVVSRLFGRIFKKGYVIAVYEEA